MKSTKNAKFDQKIRKKMIGMVIVLLIRSKKLLLLWRCEHF